MQEDNNKLAQLVHMTQELDNYHTRGLDPLEDQIVRDLVDIAHDFKEALAEEAAMVARDAVMENPINFIKVKEAEATFLYSWDEDPYLAEGYEAFYHAQDDAVLASKFQAEQEWAEERSYERGYDEGYELGKQDGFRLKEDGPEFDSWEGTAQEVLSAEDEEAFRDDFASLMASIPVEAQACAVATVPPSSKAEENDSTTFKAEHGGIAGTPTHEVDKGGDPKVPTAQAAVVVEITEEDDVEWALLPEEEEDLIDAMLAHVTDDTWKEDDVVELREFLRDTMCVSSPPLESTLYPVSERTPQEQIIAGLGPDVSF